MSFNITIGEMRQVGTFKQNQPIDNVSGGQSDNYVTLLTCRGRLRKRSGKKISEQGELMIDQNYEWVCRYQGNLVINTDTALFIGGIMYRINDYEKVDQLNHFYRFNIAIFQ